ncbi:hypothetical protein HCU62_04495 [Dissulfurirhabdus thermomarina]|nr:CD1871A family CXXC motif-containing protein [Dissulfurirhabdus thermomarina]NMX23195.1 hypothetical protein [Dissulfurirhabdus thermomarina]
MSRRHRIGSWVVLGLSLAALVQGLLAGEAEVLWRKAITVCLSCIGIG